MTVNLLIPVASNLICVQCCTLVLPDICIADNCLCWPKPDFCGDLYTRKYTVTSSIIYPSLLSDTPALDLFVSTPHCRELTEERRRMWRMDGGVASSGPLCCFRSLNTMLSRDQT